MIFQLWMRHHSCVLNKSRYKSDLLVAVALQLGLVITSPDFSLLDRALLHAAISSHSSEVETGSVVQ